MSSLLVAGIDLETTGLDVTKGHRIVELAMVLYDVDTDTLEHSNRRAFCQRINPQRPIDPAAQAVHGISFEAVAMCPVWEEVAPKVSRIMSATKTIVAHNGIGFDMPFITHELMRVGAAVPEVHVVDTMTSARWATPNGKNPSLGELCFATDTAYDPEKAHGALYDVETMLECYFKALKQGFFTLQ